MSDLVYWPRICPARYLFLVEGVYFNLLGTKLTKRCSDCPDRPTCTRLCAEVAGSLRANPQPKMQSLTDGIINREAFKRWKRTGTTLGNGEYPDPAE